MSRRASIVLFVLLLRTSVVFGQSLSINIEGPWIYYVDDQFKNETGQSESVLIAMSPKVDNHVASFSTGDGFVIDKPGLYCIGFDGVCAPAHVGPKASLPGRILRVKTPTAWSWHEKLDKSSIYLIFPLPDDYSNDGVYRMKFGQKFKTYGAEKKQSIGLVLHYANGPSTINLSSDCADAAASKCPFDDYFQDQDNSGTLRIAVKAPDDVADSCDNHVREAFHKMLLAIHSGSLQMGSNANQDHGYVDLPAYDTRCYQTDPQDDGNVKYKIDHKGEPRPLIDVAAQLKTIIQDLGNDEFAGHELFRSNLVEDGKLLGIYGAELVKGKVPFYSQLVHLHLLLTASTDALDRLEVADGKTLTPRDKAKEDEKILIDYIRATRSALSGKNCRVAQMLIP